MKYSSWEQLGDELKDSIWEAVETGNFSSLSQTVSNTIDQAVGTVTGRNRSQEAGGSTYQHGGSASSAGQTAPEYSNYTAGQKRQPSKKLFSSGIGARIGGTIMAWVGGFCAVICALSAISLLFDPWIDWSTVIALVVFTAGAGAVTYSGISRLRLLRRYRKYVCLLDGHSYYDVNMLADLTGRPVRAVQKDLKQIIIHGWFREGYLDRSGTCLMLTEQAHQQYLSLMDQTRRQKEEEAERERLRQRAKEREAEERARSDAEHARTEEERRQKEEELRRQEEERYAHLSPEVRDIIRTGDDYVAKVHKLNDEIPGEEISAKISRMELLLDRIFDRVENHPESASDVRRLMDYYLPMTVKLLEAYRDMDAQPFQVANITSSKQEIEKTLDTLNTAFEKLLDDLFMDTAWDLSSDISVLNTLLAQDGLAGRDIRNGNKSPAS